MMSDVDLLKRLQYTEGQKLLVLNAPVGYLERLSGLPVDTHPNGQYDFVHLFVQDRQELSQAWPVVLAAFNPDGNLWLAYPKLSSGVLSDLTRDAGWAPVEEAGYQAVRQIAIDETWSALRFKKVVLETPQQAIEAQFAGAKSGLKPIYAKILAAVQGFSGDVQLNPRQSYIAFARKQQFAVIKASTSARLDLGLRLKNPPVSPRMKPAAGLGSGSINYTVSLISPDQVDEQVIDWLKQAYTDA
jgi:predicted transport protein